MFTLLCSFLNIFLFCPIETAFAMQNCLSLLFLLDFFSTKTKSPIHSLEFRYELLLFLIFYFCLMFILFFFFKIFDSLDSFNLSLFHG